MKVWVRIRNDLLIMLLLLLLVFFLSLSHGQIFTTYFGSIHPIIAFVVVGALGGILIDKLIVHHIVPSSYNIKKATYTKVFLLGLSFGVFISFVDVIFVLPEDINVALMQGLLFYPIMGFIVEVIFHLLPLYLLTTFFKISKSTSVRYVIYFIATLEPVFQTWFGYIEGYSISYWIILNCYLFAFNILQLKILINHGFLPAYVMRLGLYLVWHIIWGHFRIDVLF